jgi:hypothetical protein
MRQIVIVAVTAAVLFLPASTGAQTLHGRWAKSWDAVSNRQSTAVLGWNSFCYTPHCYSWRTIGGHEPLSREYSYSDRPWSRKRPQASGNSYYCGRRDFRSCLEFVLPLATATGRPSDELGRVNTNRKIAAGGRRRIAMPIYLISTQGVARVQYVQD